MIYNGEEKERGGREKAGRGCVCVCERERERGGGGGAHCRNC